MADLDERLRELDHVAAPDLWADIRVRDPRPSAGRPNLGRLATIAAAVLVAGVGVVFAATAFLGGGTSSILAPRANGQIAYLVGDLGAGRYARVEVVNPDGSGRRELMRTPGIGLMSWSPDGTRLAFSRGGFEGGPSDIYVLRSNGTGLRQLTHDDGQNSEPTWSPDGSRIAFTSDRAGRLPEGIRHFDVYVMNADGSHVVRVTTAQDIALSPTWSPDGSRIAFLARRDGRWGLWMVGSNGGVENRILECDVVECHTPAPQWSPDGSRIMFVGGDNDEIQTIGIDGRGLRTIYRCDGECAEVSGAVWSPDGTQVAFASITDRVGDPWILFAMQADGSGLRKIADGCCPAWLPAAASPSPSPTVTPTQAPGASNGEIWVRVGGGDGPSSVYSVQPDGSGQTLLFHDGRDPSAPSEKLNREAIGEDYAWSPDGARVAFLGYSGYDDTQGEHTAVFVMNPDGTGRIQLTGSGHLDSGPSWSPDGTRIAYAGDRAGPYPYEVGCWATTLCPSDIYVVDSDGTGDVRLTDDPADDSQPQWSPDGTKIVFTSARDDAGGDIYTMNADGSEVTRLTFDSGSERNPQWSPDGTRIAFLGFQPQGNVEVYVMNADGSNVTRLTDNIGNSFVQDLDWSPDGTMIAFSSDNDGALALYLMNADGTGVTKVMDGASGIAWRPA